MFDVKTLLILIPALPLAAALATAALGPRVLRGRSHLPVVAALALSFVASILLVFQVQGQIDQPGTARQRGARLRKSHQSVDVGATFPGDEDRVSVSPGSIPEPAVPGWAGLHD